MTRIRRVLPLLSVAGILITSSASASAASVTWNLQNVVFGVGSFAVGGGTVTGSFAYDADTDTYSSVNLSSSFGSTVDVLPFSSGGGVNLYTVTGTGDLTGDFAIYLRSAAALTNAGGTIAVSFVAAGTCNQAACSSIAVQGASDNHLGADAGSLVSGDASAPEPASLVLAAGGLIACWKGRRRYFPDMGMSK